MYEWKAFQRKENDERARDLGDAREVTGFKLMESAKEQLPSARQIKCDVCDVWCSGNISYQSHIQGKPHYVNLQKQNGTGTETDGTECPPAKKPRKSGKVLEERRCDLCNISMLGQEQFEFHLKGARHLRKLNEKETASDVQNPHVVETPGKGFRCTICNVDMSGKAVVLSHLKGGKHLRNLNCPKPPQAENGQTKKNEPYECKICHIFVNSPSVLAQHEDSPKHKSKAAKKSVEEAAADQKISNSAPYDAWDPQG